MKRYEDYLDDTSKIDWTKYVIVVPTENDRTEVLKSFEHMHDADIDTDFVTVNQLCHEYGPLYQHRRDGKLTPECDPKNHNLIVNKKLYEEIKDKIKEYYS